MGLKPLIFTFAALLSFGFTAPAQADFLSVAADVPISHSFKNSSLEADGAPSGVSLQVKLPLMVGLGVEQYDTKLKGGTTHVMTDLYDVFFQLPIPVINISFGAGLGKTQIKCDSCAGIVSYKDANTTTTFAQLGFSILPLVDLHAGVHNTQGKVESTIVGTGVKGKTDIGGTITTVGLSIGF